MPYTGGDPNLIDLQAQITALKARLDALDGQDQGSSSPARTKSPARARVILYIEDKDGWFVPGREHD